MNKEIHGYSVPPGRDRPLLSSSQQHERKRSDLLAWWYNVAVPHGPSQHASASQQEVVERGRILSLILLIMFVILLAMLPTTISSSNSISLRIVTSTMFATSLLLFLNRLGYVLVATILVVVVIDAAFALTVLLTPGGLGAYNLPVFDFLVCSVVAAAFLLPPRSVFWVALGNCLFIWADLLYQPHTGELEHILTMSDFGYTVIVRPIALQVVVAVVAYFWVRRAVQATRRAQRAEVIAELEHAIAEKEHAIAEQKHQLDVGIQRLLQTHTQVANGDLSARAPLTQDNVLWQVAVSLNTLIARQQRTSLTAQEHHRLNTEIEHFAEALRSAKRKRQPLEYPSRGTPLDVLVRELIGTYIVQAGHASMRKESNTGGSQAAERDVVRFRYQQR